MDFRNREKRYRTLSETYKERFGRKVFKVPIDGGFTCPNKDGSKGSGGCIYCSPSGSGDFTAEASLSVRDQFFTLKRRMEEKWPDALTMPYFQANTNTYAPVSTLRPMFEAALDLDESVVGIAIATRCDCLPDAVLDLLEALNKKKPVQLELGLQSIHARTAEWINRGHDLACFDAAVRALKKRGLEVVVHIINGLPGESDADMLKTVDHLNALQIDGIKIHMLHVMEHTALGHRYKKAPFHLLSLEEYVAITTRQIERLDPDVVIHRLSGDAPRDTLIAPEWTLKKFVVMNEIDKALRRRDTYQGYAFKR
ncbi:MAG: TIGR01212 family radical SAM protein [Candidatus Izemoplasmataceae bacterium]